MSYQGIALAASDPVLRRRIAACVAQEQEQVDPPPEVTAGRLAWTICAEPGWGEAWESAIAADNQAPGSDPGVIPDAWILTAVQKHLPPPPGEPVKGEK
jgi:hypothetical protein